MHFTYVNEKDFNVLKLNKNYKNSSFYKLTKQIDFNQNNPGKTYLSEGIWELVIDKENKSKIFSEANIFHFRDFLDYKIFPFNGHFKNSSKYQLRKAERKMYSIIKPEFEEINNNIFFNLFNIKYLLILESEINKIHSTKFEEISRIKFENDNILLFEIIDERRAIIKKQNINQINKCKNFPMVKCLLNINSLFHLSDNISFKRLGLNKYEIINNSDKSKKIVLPFLYDYGWKSEIGSIQDINKTLFYLEVESNSKDIIYYKDSVRLYLKLLSIFTFFFLILIIATYNKKFTNN